MRPDERRDEQGIAMITVILIMMVMTMLAVIITANANSQLTGVSRQRDITTARAAADAGVDRLVFVLQQATGGTANWDTYPTSYSTAAASWWGDPSNGGWWPAGRGRYRAHIDVAPDTNQRLVTVQAEYPTGSGHQRTVRAVLQRQAPAALNFAMFADKGVDIHHHSSSYITPTVITTAVHSNGYIDMDYSATFRVDAVEAVTSVVLGGGGSVPVGNGTSAYNWPYWISGSDTTNPARCYPPKQFPPKDFTSTYWQFPDASNACPSSSGYKWSPHALVVGDVRGNSVTVSDHGTVKKPSGSPADFTPERSGSTCSGGATLQAGFNDPITNACIPERAGNVDAASVSVGGRTYTGPATGMNTLACPTCNKGSADVGGGVGGVLNLHPQGWAPSAVPFPSLDYRTVNYPMAVADQGGSPNACSGPAPASSNCHVFPTPNAARQSFTTWMADKNNVAYTSPSANPCSAGKCLVWLDSSKRYTNDPTQVAYVLLKGTYFLTAGQSLSLDLGNIRKAFLTPVTAPAPTILIQGALIVESGTMAAKSSLTIVGETMDPFNPALPSCGAPGAPIGCVPANTRPGLLAVGGSINASDYDSDSSWTSAGSYQRIERNSTIVRGLVYSGTWSATARKSISADQHWHNYDPKNSVMIIGAQVGGKLHDCNSFSFSYDPLVANLAGFTGGGGGIYVLSWSEV